MFAYEQLAVYKKSYQFNQKVYRLLKNDRNLPLYIKNQLGRAALSIMLNIAEGSAKFTKNDRKNFLIIARASAFETCALINFLYDENDISLEEKKEFDFTLNEISAILYAMITKLKS
jgi:four helix bundle protein